MLVWTSITPCRLGPAVLNPADCVAQPAAFGCNSVCGGRDANSRQGYSHPPGPWLERQKRAQIKI